MNEVFSPNTVVTSSSPPESPVESKRDDRKRKEVQLQAAMEGEKGVMDALKHQMAYRDGKISSLQEKYKSSLKSIAELEEKLSSQSKSNAETNMRYFELSEQTETLEKQLSQSKRVIKALKKAVEEAQEAKQHAENNNTEAKRIKEFMEARVLGVTEEKTLIEQEKTAKIEELQFSLTEANRISNFVQSKLASIEKEKEEEKKANDNKIQELEFSLSETKRISAFVEAKLKQCEKDKADLEGEAQDKGFQLTEARRVSTFVQDRLAKIDMAKNEALGKIKSLEQDQANLKIRLGLKNNLIEAQEKKFDDQVKMTKELEEQNKRVRGELAVATKMMSFLQGSLADAEAVKIGGSLADSPSISSVAMNDSVDQMKSDVNRHKNQVEDLSKKLELADEEQTVTVARVGELTAQVAMLQTQIDTWDSEGPKAELEKQVDEQEKAIEALTEKLYAAENDKSKGNATFDLADTALVDLELRLTQAEVANKALQEEIAELLKENSFSTQKIRSLQMQLACRF